MNASSELDLVVVGAGIVGLAHAYDGLRRGLRVAVVERDERPVGASVRNFGHICLTAQEGRPLRYGLAARESWVTLAGLAGFWLSEAGTVVAARADDEMAVLEEFAATHGDSARLLDRDGVLEHAPVDDSELVGGAWLPMDLRVDPREAAPAIASWLASQGVQFSWGSHVLEVGSDFVRTANSACSGVRGGGAPAGMANSLLRAPATVVAVGHDVDRLFPDVAAEAGVKRCLLQMFRVMSPQGRTYAPGVFTGLSLLRYGGFTSCPSSSEVRKRFETEQRELLEVDMNLMFTQRPDGDLNVGDTHSRSVTPSPFHDEHTANLVLQQASRLLGVERLDIRERWTGVYASAEQDFLIESPMPGVAVVSVTSGIGMTTAFGLAPEVLDDLLK